MKFVNHILKVLAKIYSIVGFIWSVRLKKIFQIQRSFLFPLSSPVIIVNDSN